MGISTEAEAAAYDMVMMFEDRLPEDLREKFRAALVDFHLACMTDSQMIFLELISDRQQRLGGQR